MTTENLLTFRIIKYGMTHDIFTIAEMAESLKLSDGDQKFIQHNLLTTHLTTTTPNSLISTVVNLGEHKRTEDAIFRVPCRILPNAIFFYIDHQEIVLAKEATIEAREASNKSIGLAHKSIKQAWVSIWISIAIGVVSLVIGGFQLYYQVK